MYCYIFNDQPILGILTKPLLENMLSTLVIYDFLHRFLINVESIDVESITVNIGFKKLMLT